MSEVNNFGSSVVLMLLDNFLDLAKVPLFNLANFLFLDLDNFLFNLNLKLLTLALLLAVSLPSSGLLEIIYGWLAKVFYLEVSGAAILVNPWINC